MQLLYHVSPEGILSVKHSLANPLQARGNGFADAVQKHDSGIAHENLS